MKRGRNKDSSPPDPPRPTGAGEGVGPAQASARGHSFWRRLARRALPQVSTPCFLFAAEPLAEAVASLEDPFRGLPIRSWWSMKTLALEPALRWWRAQGRPVEVVSDLELRRALEWGFEVEEILINGPAKHHWLPAHPLRGLRVNLDSPAEAAALIPLARRLKWHLGVRINTSGEENLEFPGIRSQFGMVRSELTGVAERLQRAGLTVEVLHFHLRTNVENAEAYGHGLAQVRSAAAELGWRPRCLDLGGGFPPERVTHRSGCPLDGAFSLMAMRDLVSSTLGSDPWVREIWFENGRRLAAPGGVLAIRVLEVKEGRGARTLICDGGRTLQAMVATWENHRLIPLRSRRGALVSTLVCGPTCMAFDNLGMHDLPVGTRPGDVLLWLDAGAYQLSWETRFSHGLAAVVWSEGSRLTVVREAGGCRTGIWNLRF